MSHWTEELFLDRADAFATFFERRFEDAQEDVAELLELLAESYDHHPETVLDVPCGTGRHVLAFADAGLEATGIDISPEFINRGKALAGDHDLDDRTTFHEGDMRDLDTWEHSYDLAVIIWNSLGYYDRQTDVEILGGVRECLADDGRLVIEATNKDFHLTEREPASVQELEEHLHVTRTEYDVETARVTTTVDVFEIVEDSYEHLETLTFKPRLYAPVELEELCREAGFESVEMYGDFDGSLLTLESPRVVVVAGD